MDFNQLLLLKINLTESVKSRNLKAVLTSEDLRVYCVPNRIIQSTDLVHDGTFACVLTSDGNADYLLVSTRQHTLTLSIGYSYRL